MALSTAQLPEISDVFEKVKDEVRRGLSGPQKSLSPWLFYDEEGSRLFEQITEVEEYYVTRTERAILERSADEIVRLATGGERARLVELGAGSGIKTELLLNAVLRRQMRLEYVPIDVSPTALEYCRGRLERRVKHLKVLPRVEDYTEGLTPLPDDHTRAMVLWIGSSMGNFSPRDAEQILAHVRSRLKPGDSLLLGTDNVKTEPVLVAAYNDKAGVTAAFNRNVLVRLNRELGANFHVNAFEHRAVWNAAESRMEMHLVSRRAQLVTIPATGQRVRFAAGETIHTENSYKFTAARVRDLLHAAGFVLTKTWSDRRKWFGVHLAVVG